MKPGKYVVDVVDCGMVVDRNDQAQPFLVFKNEAGETIQWRGYLGSDKSKEYAVKALMTCGFKGLDWADLSKGLSSFNLQKVSITVENQKGKDGKERIKVSWINPLRETLSPEEVKAKASDKALFHKMGASWPKATDAGF